MKRTKAHNELAEFIADGILSTCGTDIAYRIALKQGTPTNEKDLGGLCRDALVNRIEALLEAEATQRRGIGRTPKEIKSILAEKREQVRPLLAEISKLEIELRGDEA